MGYILGEENTTDQGMIDRTGDYFLLLPCLLLSRYSGRRGLLWGAAAYIGGLFMHMIETVSLLTADLYSKASYYHRRVNRRRILKYWVTIYTSETIICFSRIICLEVNSVGQHWFSRLICLSVSVKDVLTASVQDVHVLTDVHI